MSQPASKRTAVAKRISALDLRLEYRGFRNTKRYREYLVHACIGDQERDYVVGIEQTAFAARRVALQDGPDICFQRLSRELSGGVLAALGTLAISDDELAAYRVAHLPVTRVRSQPRTSPSPASEAATPTGPDEGRGVA
jgi:hypothetical protein